MQCGTPHVLAGTHKLTECSKTRASVIKQEDVTLILDDVTADVLSQMNQQSQLGVRITRHNEVPETGPTNSGRWFRVPQVTAVFADLKNSTGLNVASSPKDAAFAYTYFIRAMTVALDRFSAQYIDIQGDGIFGLFSGARSKFKAAACAVTMQTMVEREVAAQFKEDSDSDWELTAGIGVDCDTLLVRRLGLRGTKMNEVWAGKPVSVAAKLSSVAGRNQVVVSERTFRHYQNFSQLRRKALLHSCGCSGQNQGIGLDAPLGGTLSLWQQLEAPVHIGLDFKHMYRRTSCWCKVHGAQFCEALVTGKRPRG